MFRNHSKAFDLEGTITVENPSENEIIILHTDRTSKNEARLENNFKTKGFNIYETRTNLIYHNKNGITHCEELSRLFSYNGSVLGRTIDSLFQDYTLIGRV